MIYLRIKVIIGHFLKVIKISNASIIYCPICMHVTCTILNFIYLPQLCFFFLFIKNTNTNRSCMLEKECFDPRKSILDFRTSIVLE